MAAELGLCGRRRGTTSALQWGRSLLAAEFSTRPQSRCRLHGASMGPQPVGCGIRVICRASPLIRPASMGPQPVGCGIDHASRRGTPQNWASMGPQPVGCGIYAEALRVGSEGVQWAAACWRGIESRLSAGPRNRRANGQPVGCGVDSSKDIVAGVYPLHGAAACYCGISS